MARSPRRNDDMNIKELRAARAAKLAELKTLADKETKGEALADNECSRFDTLETEIRGIDENLGRQERIAEMERRAPANPIGERRDGMLPDLGNYQLARVVRALPGERLDGLEGEVEQELSRGREVRGHMVPTEILLPERRAAQTVGSDPAGGYTVSTTIGTLADRFRPALRTESMGATVLRGLVGNLDLPNLVSSGTASWVVEGGTPTRTGVTFEKTSMSPKTVTAEYEMSRRIMLQSGTAIEGLLRRDLGYLLAQALDGAGIMRRGASEAEPDGILDQDGLTKVTTETFFADTCANCIAELELDDVMGSGAFITSPKVHKTVMKIKETSTDRPIPESEIFHQKPVQYTTQVPDTIGSGSNKSALIYGLWSELVIGYWSGVDILLNPYHSDVASKGGALLHAFLDADVAVRHVEAFAYAEI
jgi:HK97 family phage major capsid protein